VTSGTARPVLLTGATGQLGLFALPALLARGHSVVALSRREGAPSVSNDLPPPGEVRWACPGDLPVEPAARGKTTPGWLDEIEVILSCGPLQLAVDLVPECANLRRLVCISTSSVLTKRHSPDAAERELIGRIGAAEIRLKNLCAGRGIELSLLRPTLIYGCGLDENVSRIARVVDRFGFMPVAGRAAGLRQPLHAEDLAGLAVRLATCDPAIEVESEVGGGSVLSYREMVERVFAALGRKPRLLSLPPGLLAFLTQCIAWLPGMRGLNAGFVLRQSRDQVFDDSQLKLLTGFKPRPFSPTRDDFRPPAAGPHIAPGRTMY